MVFASRHTIEHGARSHGGPTFRISDDRRNLHEGCIGNLHDFAERCGCGRYATGTRGACAARRTRNAPTQAATGLGLAKVIDAWPKLSDAVRKGILAMVEAANQA